MIQNRQGAAIWWRRMTPDPARDHRGDRAALAQLRRCPSVAAAMQQPATIQLFQLCQATEAYDLPAISLAAAVLAHVREDVSGRVAGMLGPESSDRPETALLKPLRFRRLLEASDVEECLPAFRRLVALMSGKANVGDLAAALFDWPDRYRGDERKRRWVFDYWKANPQGAAAQPAEEPVA
ncbi:MULTISPECIES: type I-E CRISPR-associated protein Cse2/CasB [Roseomonadaceae]|uniref:Type I-E CRISPR-associated protein Cse2/CasB n=1 Tax=Falsiroseomonas oleicola TaxID=2801474 RepID=A0ABS6HDE3_9PROT|nr:type I-E CRISPR-associated protein Cse2/CasB [Roseomonas oleicola]MBU8546678.1 type I-E CRISPR-associated protein Cse2/CasB [Roseomonas oleicola]